jgi:hypothetical protein
MCRLDVMHYLAMQQAVLICCTQKQQHTPEDITLESLTTEIVACIARSLICLIFIASHIMTPVKTESGGGSAHLYLWKRYLLLKILILDPWC